VIVPVFVKLTLPPPYTATAIELIGSKSPSALMPIVPLLLKVVVPVLAMTAAAPSRPKVPSKVPSIVPWLFTVTLPLPGTTRLPIVRARESTREPAALASMAPRLLSVMPLPPSVIAVPPGRVLMMAPDCTVTARPLALLRKLFGLGGSRIGTSVQVTTSLSTGEAGVQAAKASQPCSANIASAASAPSAGAVPLRTARLRPLTAVPPEPLALFASSETTRYRLCRRSKITR